MKKHFILLLVGLTYSVFALSQALLIKDLSGNDVTNSTYTFTNGPKDSDWEASFTVELPAGDTVSKGVALRRFETKVCTGSQNYFCWTTCYGALNAGVKPVWEDGDVAIERDSVFVDFHVYYKENGTGADAEFLYVLYDTANVNDSVTLRVKFDAGQPECTVSSLNTFYEQNISVYPNPATDNFTVENALNSDVIEMQDILGKSVYKNTNISNIHNISGLEPGIYILKIIREGNLYDTQRIIKK